MVTIGKQSFIDVDDFNEYCTEYINSFTQDLMDNCDWAFYELDVEEQWYDYADNLVTKVWSNRAVGIVERARKRYFEIGSKHFDEFDIEIRCDNMVEE